MGCEIVFMVKKGVPNPILPTISLEGVEDDSFLKIEIFDLSNKVVKALLVGQGITKTSPFNYVVNLGMENFQKGNYKCKIYLANTFEYGIIKVEE